MKLFSLTEPEWWHTANNLTPWSAKEGAIPGLDFAYGTINNKSKLAHIRDIAVSESRRRQGVGRRVVQELEQFLRDNGATRVDGWAKEGSEPFWIALGYKITEVRGHLPRISKILPRVTQPGTVTKRNRVAKVVRKRIPRQRVSTSLQQTH